MHLQLDKSLGPGGESQSTTSTKRARFQLLNHRRRRRAARQVGVLERRQLPKAHRRRESHLEDEQLLRVSLV